MAFENDFDDAIEKTSALARLKFQIDLSVKLHAIAAELISDGKLDEASGVLKAMGEITNVG